MFSVRFVTLLVKLGGWGGDVLDRHPVVCSEMYHLANEVVGVMLCWTGSHCVCCEVCHLANEVVGVMLCWTGSQCVCCEVLSPC